VNVTSANVTSASYFSAGQACGLAFRFRASLQNVNDKLDAMERSGGRFKKFSELSKQPAIEKMITWITSGLDHVKVCFILTRYTPHLHESSKYVCDYFMPHRKRRRPTQGNAASSTNACSRCKQVLRARPCLFPLWNPLCTSPCKMCTLVMK